MICCIFSPFTTGHGVSPVQLDSDSLRCLTYKAIAAICCHCGYESKFKLKFCYVFLSNEVYCPIFTLFRFFCEGLLEIWCKYAGGLSWGWDNLRLG